MHLYKVGDLYHGTKRVWPQTPQFNFRSGETELVIFLDGPTRHEVAAVQSGPAEFGLYVYGDQILLLYQFDAAKGFRGGIPWSDAPYTWHRVPVSERVAPPPINSLSPETRALLHVILVDAAGGAIRVLRVVSLSPEFTRQLYAAIAEQAARPWDEAKYDRELERIYQQHTSAHLAETCSIRCKGGA